MKIGGVWRGRWISVIHHRFFSFKFLMFFFSNFLKLKKKSFFTLKKSTQNYIFWSEKGGISPWISKKKKARACLTGTRLTIFSSWGFFFQPFVVFPRKQRWEKRDRNQQADSFPKRVPSLTYRSTLTESCLKMRGFNDTIP